MATKVRSKMDIHYTMERIPENCAECPAFSTSPYSCMNERGEEGHCELGYMSGHDMRDFRGRKKFAECKLETDFAHITIDPDAFKPKETPNLKPCPYCGEKLTTEHTGFRHPANNCILSNIIIGKDQFDDWNKRVEDNDETS